MITARDVLRAVKCHAGKLFGQSQDISPIMADYGRILWSNCFQSRLWMTGRPGLRCLKGKGQARWDIFQTKCKIPELGRQKQEDESEFKTSLVSIDSTKLASSTEWEPVSTHKHTHTSHSTGTLKEIFCVSVCLGEAGRKHLGKGCPKPFQVQRFGSSLKCLTL